MNDKEKKAIINECNVILGVDVPNIIKSAFPDRKWEELFFSGISVAASIKLLNKAMNNLKVRLMADEFNVIPSNIVPSVNLLQHLQNVRAFLTQGNFPDAIVYLGYIIAYEMMLGFWNDPVDISRNFDIDGKIVELKAYESLIKTDINSLKSRLEEQSADFQKVKSNLDTTLSTFNTNLAASTNSLKNSQAEESAIKNINNTVAELKGKLAGILENQQKNLDGSKTELGKLEVANKTYEVNIKEIEKQKSIIVQESANFEKARKDLDEQLNLCGNKTLTYNFANRSRWLLGSTILWTLFIVGAFAASGWWIYFAFVGNEDLAGLFSKIKTSTNMDVLLFTVIAAVKIFPVWILLQFVFKNYSKERHLWEAYSFKAAVAATLRSYAAQLVSEKFTLKREDFSKEPNGQQEWEKYMYRRDECRKELMRTTIESLYKEVNFNDVDPQAKREAKKDWKRFKEIVSLVKDTAGTVTNKTKP